MVVKEASVSDRSMKPFIAQVKEVKRLSTTSNDLEYRLVLITNELPSELFNYPADENIVVKLDKE